MLEASNPLTQPDIVAAVTAFGSDIEFQAKVLETLDVAKRHPRSGNRGDPVINVQQVLTRFGRENDRSTDHAPSFSR
jgi:hypothetical protein